ncbi:MAG: peptide chain release factor N(5)-glutamine methyltransferase [Demequinaceae bacterium]|nr:peptide chain release factor N(5)-glutamine methyltransferase [Demequinaceae bacterium]
MNGGWDAPFLAPLLRDVTARLAEAGIPSPEHDAAALVGFSIGMPVDEVRTAAARGDHLPEGFSPDDLDRLITRRSEREPLQHLTGRAYFGGLEILVGPGVFIPRPETEVVAAVAIEVALACAAGGPVEVVDLCAGSGAIGLAIAHAVPEARLTLVEVDDEALRWLRLNVAAAPAGVSARVEVLHADAQHALKDRPGAFDIVVANPPYIPSDGTPVEPEAAHDPARSLWGLGEDGLEVPRAVIATAARLLKREGTFIMEHADSQGPAVREELIESGAWEGVGTGQDLTGRDRFALARRA